MEVEKNTELALSWQQACLLMNGFAEDTSFPHLQSNACGPRTEYMISHMLQSGVNPAIIGRALNVVPDLSPEGIGGLYSPTRMEIMHSHARKAQPSFDERKEVAQLLGHTVKDNAIYTEHAEIKHCPKSPEGEWIVITPTSRQGVAHWEPNNKTPSLYHNHIMPIIDVIHPETNQTQSMVIDFQCSTEHPVSLEEWKLSQNYGESVIATAKLGEAYVIHEDTLSETGKERFSALQKAFNDRPQTIEERDAFVGEFLNFDAANPTDSVTRALTLKFGSDTPNWHKMSETEFEKKQQFISECLMPLAEYQCWTQETDEHITAMKCMPLQGMLNSPIDPASGITDVAAKEQDHTISNVKTSPHQNTSPFERS